MREREEGRDERSLRVAFAWHFGEFMHCRYHLGNNVSTLIRCDIVSCNIISVILSQQLQGSLEWLVTK